MRNRDQLTYDLDQPRRGSVPRGPLGVLAAVVLATVGLVGWVIAGADPAPSAAGQPTVTATTTHLAPTPTPSGTPPASGSDAREGLAVPEGSPQAASRFVLAWLDRNPVSRKTALQQIAAPALAEELMLTDPRNVPRARPRGAPVLANASTYSVQFTQTLTTGTRIQVYLVAYPAARYRWLATSVEQA